MSQKKIRPDEYSDLDIIWAIRDIPKSILNIKLKSILYTFVALIGNSTNEWHYKSLDDLAEIIGIHKSNLSALLYAIEDLDFLKIKRPAKYLKGMSNEYQLNYELIVQTAKMYGGNS